MIHPQGDMFRALQVLLVCWISVLTAGCATAPAKVEPKLVLWPPPPELPRFKYETSIYGSANVTVLPEDVQFQMMLTGQKLPNVTMEKPYGVAVRNGRMYVTDTALSLIHVFDFARKRYFRMGYRFEGKLTKPFGVAADKNGLVYVADGEQKRVVVYDGIGLYQKSIGSKSDFARPTAVAVDDTSDHVYVLDTGGIDTDQHQVVVFSRNGDKLFTFGGRGYGKGKFNLPQDVAVGPEGKVYVLDSGNFKVQVFDKNGMFIREWGEVGTGFGQFSRPKSITVDADGLVYVSDTQFGNIQIFDQKSRLLLFIGENSEIDSPGKFSLLAGIAADDKHRVYAVDQRFKKVEILRRLAPEEARALMGGKI